MQVASSYSFFLYIELDHYVRAEAILRFETRKIWLWQNGTRFCPSTIGEWFYFRTEIEGEVRCWTAKASPAHAKPLFVRVVS
jgi:hypothetical protein